MPSRDSFDIPAFDVALIYAREDEKIASELAKVLRESDLSVFIEDEPSWRSPSPEDPFFLNLSRSRIVILLLSKAAAPSWRFRRAADVAFDIVESRVVLCMVGQASEVLSAFQDDPWFRDRLYGHLWTQLTSSQGRFDRARAIDFARTLLLRRPPDLLDRSRDWYSSKARYSIASPWLTYLSVAMFSALAGLYLFRPEAKLRITLPPAIFLVRAGVALCVIGFGLTIIRQMVELVAAQRIYRAIRRATSSGATAAGAQ
jgi:hypothetical protein